MSNKNFTLTYDELLLLLKDAYRNGYSTYEMTAAGLEPYDDDGYARWVLLGMEKNKQRKEIIKKWEESGLLDGLTEMDKDHPMLKVLEANGKQGINELPDVKPMMEKNKQEKEQIMDTMCQQLQMEVNASETQKYYKSKEVQDLDNPTDVVDEYESMGNLDKMSIKNQNGFFAKPMLLAVISFFMRNLEFIPLCFALQFWFDAGNRWEYWVTVFLVGTFSGISTAYNKYNNY